MAVKDVRRDTANLALIVTAEFDAPVEQVWQLWADPRKLERWWGPPTYPATFVEHSLAPGSMVTYYMTSPEGDRYHGYWTILASNAPSSLVLRDGFADDSGAPNPDMPINETEVTLSERDGGGTVMVMRSQYPSAEAMEQLLTMGMEEGLMAAMGQMDAILAA